MVGVYVRPEQEVANVKAGPMYLEEQFAKGW